MSASAMTITGILRATLALHALAGRRAARVDLTRDRALEPTKLTDRTTGWSSIALTTSRPPLTRFRTPAAARGRRRSPNTFCIVSGTRSEGLMTTVFPHAIA